MSGIVIVLVLVLDRRRVESLRKPCPALRECCRLWERTDGNGSP
jgi:hypothetical protein